MTSDSVAANLEASPGSASILVVEDEIIIRMAVADEMRHQGYSVIEAGNADEALAILRANIVVDVVVADLRMPGSMHGGELVRLLRSEFTSLKIVMVSGHLPEAHVRSLLDGYLAKPILPSEVVHFVRRLVLPHAEVEVS